MEKIFPQPKVKRIIVYYILYWCKIMAKAITIKDEIKKAKDKLTMIEALLNTELHKDPRVTLGVIKGVLED